MQPNVIISSEFLESQMESSIQVVSIGREVVCHFDGREVQVSRSVNFVMDLLRILQIDIVLHAGIMSDSREVVVP
jgi:hypothetical protein